MRVGIDIRPLRDVRTGIGHYISSLLDAIAHVDQTNEYIMFYNGFGPDIPHGLPMPPNFKLTAFHWPRKMLTAVWAYGNFPKIDKLLGDIDVFHAPGFQVPPSRKVPKVFTIYDLVPITHPEFAIPSAIRHVRPRFKYYIGRADLIVAISKATADEISRVFKISEDRIITIYPGTIPIAPASAEDNLKMKKKYALTRDYLLFVSRIDPRKNLPRLFRAFDISGLAGDYDLIIAGPEGWHMEETLKTWQGLKCKDQIRWLNYVTDSELSCLYSGAKFFVYPSLLEGFGLPILEAMSVGCPVMTSNVSSMPEVAGDAAVYVDPQDINSISQGLRLLADDESLRVKLSKLGKERTALFTWEKTARQMIEVYERARQIRGSKS